MTTIVLSALAGALVGIPIGAYLAVKVLPRVFKRFLMSRKDWGAAASLKLQSEESVATFVRHLATHYELDDAETVLAVADAILKRTERLKKLIGDVEDQN